MGSSEVTVYTYGEDLYRDMLDAIRQAKTRVFFETFIWKSDAVGQAFKDALIDAANRGVKVYLVFDEFANLVVPAGSSSSRPTSPSVGTRWSPPDSVSPATPAVTTASCWWSTTTLRSSAATTSAICTPPTGATPTPG